MTYYLIGGGLGTLSGLMLYFLALHHLKVRSEFDKKDIYNKIKNRRYAFVWILITVLMFEVITYCELERIDGTFYMCWHLIRVTIFAMFAIDVSAVDLMIRRIPNTALLAMIFLEIMELTVEVVVLGQDIVETVFKALFGAAIAYAVFSFPSAFKLAIGVGDIKYSIVLGFMLGFFNFFEAMAVMAFASILFWIYLKVFKKGNLKTAAPMGPFLSAGAMAALLAPIF
ncbi:MAG: prepilin peptidase [Lachnospiraceae bacterium]|nr:prepilin peptidase [Lachnospiraceae bacterium]